MWELALTVGPETKTVFGQNYFGKSFKLSIKYDMYHFIFHNPGQLKVDCPENHVIENEPLYTRCTVSSQRLQDWSNCSNSCLSPGHVLHEWMEWQEEPPRLFILMYI